MMPMDNSDFSDNIKIQLIDENNECVILIANKLQPFKDIVRTYSETIGLDIDSLRFHLNGLKLNNESILHEIEFEKDDLINVSLQQIGGKGGFGAALRAKAKQKGLKPTTDFGACRDLNGRRLRHVNDEIIVRKWKEANENGEKLNVDENTTTGIPMWFLDKPAWAEAVKKSGQSKFLKKKSKTDICMDWKRARESSVPPADASIHWGCPRGDKCNFAHGDLDLQGTKLETIQNERKMEFKNEENIKKEEYISSINEIVSEEAVDDIKQSILIGLKKEKAMKEEAKAKAKAMIKVVEEVDELPLDDYGF